LLHREIGGYRPGSPETPMTSSVTLLNNSAPPPAGALPLLVGEQAVSGEPRSTSVSTPLFSSFFLGGFECSCHRLECGRRLDLLATTRHEEFVRQDYARLRALGMSGCRDGIPWVRCESSGQFEFGWAAPMLHAAKTEGVQVVWDLMHFGWPDDLDVFAPAFVTRFARFARAFARWYARETDLVPLLTPINEMSFLSWAGGDVRCMNPFEAARGVELKAQLVRATIEAIEAIRAELPNARFLQPEPIINIVPSPDQPKTWRRVESDNLLQFQAWDMLVGDVWPSLGGHPRYLDIVGVNYYPNNQFMIDGTTVERGDARFRALSDMLLEVAARYRRPMIISETGTEGAERAPWLRYVAEQCDVALSQGCELHAVTLYPILNHLGWLDDRNCENGLWDHADDSGERAVFEPLARELQRHSARLLSARSAMMQRTATNPLPTTPNR
jgi:hypothetical protein